MTDRPKPARPPDCLRERTDILSRLLALCRIEGELVYTAELTLPWAAQFPAGFAHFHYVETGEIWIGSAGRPALHVGPGELALLPHGYGHLLSGQPAVEDVLADALTSTAFDGDRLLLRFGGGGMGCQVVSGPFSYGRTPVPPAIATLPDLIHIPCESGQTPDWLAIAMRSLVAEAQGRQPGSTLMISRILDLLIIGTLRTWSGGCPSRKDRIDEVDEERISRALNAMDAHPGRDWTVDKLAALAGMSRSMFAERFHAAVGEPPLRYLTRLRLTMGADLIQSRHVKVGDAARHVGYKSEAGFSRAFKAHFGYAPSQAREQSGRNGAESRPAATFPENYAI